ncbi:AzlD family protein [Roseibium alexandrii]
MDNTVLIICLCALATYLTRTGGHLILSRFGALHHRAEAALDAVPVAVLTALVAPAATTEGPAEAIAIILAGVLTLRFSLIISVSSGILSVVALRSLGL